MSWKHRVRHMLRRDQADVELDEELRFHIERQIELNIQNGMSPAEARRAAMLEFGGVEALKEECRSNRGMDWLDTTLQDVRYALRNFRRTPAFALTVIAVTALGIGATTAVFSVADRVLFRPMPYAEPDSIISLGIRIPWLEYDFLTATSYRQLHKNLAPLTSATSWSGTTNCDLTDNNPLRLTCVRVESSFLPFFGIQPALGRNFTSEEDRPNVPRVAVISHSFWKVRFGAQPDAIGRTISLDGQPVLVLGVLPEGFEMPTLDSVDLLLPQAIPPDVREGTRPLRIYARLPPGDTLPRVHDALFARAEELFTEIPPQIRKQVQFHASTLRDIQSGDLRTAAWTLLAAVLSMLLIACANAANLLLARSIARQRELSIRAALGAARLRLVRQTLTETLMLSLTGGLAGCLLAAALLKLFLYIAPTGIPHLAFAQLDLRVLAFAFCASLVCGLIFTIAPALNSPSPASLTGFRVTSAGGLHTRHLLVSGQLAVSLILLTSAGLLLQSLWQRQSVGLGVRSDHIVTAQVALSSRYSQPQARLDFFNDLAARLKRLPGVDSVALSDSLPPGGVPRSQPYFAITAEGQPPAPQTPDGGIVVWRHVSPSYFKTFGIRILRGRPFNEEDRAPNSAVVILSDSYARKLFAGAEPLGRRISRYPGAPWLTVVGVAADVRNAGLTDHNDPEYYMVRRNTADDAIPASAVILRGSAKPEILASWLRAEIASLDPVLPSVIRTFDQHIGELATRPRFQAMLLAIFAAAGLVLAASGLYGLITFLVTQREREIGVRLALGASPTEVVRLFLSHALRWTAGGLAFGIAGAFLAARALRSLLFHVSPADPPSFFAAAAILLVLALLAALLPSRRAASVDPMTTLRQD